MSQTQNLTIAAELQRLKEQLRIEAALERIRSGTMSMKQSEELEDVITVVYEQFVQLDIPVEHAGFILDYRERDDMHIWFASKQVKPSEITLPHFDSPHWNSFLKAKAERESFFANFLPFEEKNKFYTELFRHIPPLPEAAVASIFEKPGLVISTVLLDNVGLYIENYTLAPYTERENAILKRFGAVFQQTYTRFLDLQKAEKLARKAQIEAALERVRARTMGMQKSEELNETAVELFRQIERLGIKPWSCGFNIFNEEDRTIAQWVSTGDGRMLEPFQTPSDQDIFQRFYEEFKKGQQLYTEAIGGEDLISHYEFMRKLPIVGDLLNDLKNTGIEPPSFQVNNLAYFQYGYLLFITFEEVPENHSLFIRFAKVFEQTYTRFLDLQKAEAQTREAEIELALERVRARTMAMHQSSELSEAGNLLFQQLKLLGIHAETSWLWFIDSKTDEVEIWTTHENKFAKPVKVDPVKLPTVMKEVEAWKNKVPTLKLSIPESEAFGIIKQFFGIKISQDNKAEYFHLLQIRHNYGFLGLGTWKEATIEEVKVYTRFAKVFEQTFTRFLDLQKAEAQTREAQIETALERVRAQTMAMHNSEDIGECIVKMFDELTALGVDENTRFGIGILNHEDENNQLWTASKDGEELKMHIGNLDMTLHPLLKSARDAWKAQVPLHQYVLEGEDLLNYYQALNDAPDYPLQIAMEKLPERQFHYGFVFEHGFFYAFCHREFQPELIHITQRFSSQFAQTYRRYLDLVRAEAQAREAKIEASLERVRSRTMAMHKPDELQEVVRVVAEELKNTGVILDTWGAVICTYFQDSNDVVHWTAAEDPANPSIAFLLPYFRDELYDEAWTSKNRGDSYFAKVFSFEVKNAFFKHAFEHSDYRYLPDDYKKTILESKSHGIAWAWANNSAIMIPSVQGDLPSEEEKEILIRFAKVFEQAYVRFMDLQKAEEQGREARIELSLERIRAKVTAMQESSDLLDIVVKMRTEFVRLGHEAHYFWHMRWLPETYAKAMTAGDGTKIGMVMTLPRSIHGEIESVATWEKSDEPIYVLAMDADNAVDYVDKMITLGDFERVDPQAPTLDDIRHIGGLTFIMARTTHGEIGYSLPGKVPDPPKDGVETLKRFAGVFDLAYKRFEDLKAAERQALLIREERDRLEIALNELHATQHQLIQQEKLASLGQLTAGIAHEIKNPLNFVNNFSEVSIELIEEALEEITNVKTQHAASPIDQNESLDEIIAILDDVQSNLTKIHEHGTRANNIVNSMLQHSRGGSGKREATDLNALIKEYVNLSFHGMRAGKNPVNVSINLELDDTIGDIPLIAEDFSRVILNLCNNAFDAMKSTVEPQNIAAQNIAAQHIAALSIRTKKSGDKIIIEVEDNGPGIPDEIKDKILQPFFTTKKGTEGTGLGLSITNDIIKAHRGTLEIETEIHKGTKFIINLSK